MPVYPAARTEDGKSIVRACGVPYRLESGMAPDVAPGVAACITSLEAVAGDKGAFEEPAIDCDESPDNGEAKEAPTYVPVASAVEAASKLSPDREISITESESSPSSPWGPYVLNELTDLPSSGL